MALRTRSFTELSTDRSDSALSNRLRPSAERRSPADAICFRDNNVRCRALGVGGPGGVVPKTTLPEPDIFKNAAASMGRSAGFRTLENFIHIGGASGSRLATSLNGALISLACSAVWGGGGVGHLDRLLLHAGEPHGGFRGRLPRSLERHACGGAEISRERPPHQSRSRRRGTELASDLVASAQISVSKISA